MAPKAKAAPKVAPAAPKAKAKAKAKAVPKARAIRTTDITEGRAVRQEPLLVPMLLALADAAARDGRTPVENEIVYDAFEINIIIGFLMQASPRIAARYIYAMEPYDLTIWGVIRNPLSLVIQVRQQPHSLTHSLTHH